jgi:predicted nucleic acid-binding protein
MTVIDASVYVALINANESHHADSWAWFQQTQVVQEVVSAPVILLAEVAAALSRGMNNPQLAHQIVQQLLHSQVIDVVPVTVSLAERAAVIAADHQVRSCDAIYLALAEHLGDSLVTLDQQQLERGATIVATRNP